MISCARGFVNTCTLEAKKSRRGGVETMMADEDKARENRIRGWGSELLCL